MIEAKTADQRATKRGNERLLRLADYVERRQRAKPSEGYDQRTYEHSCGAPACLMGHALALFGPRRYKAPAPRCQFIIAGSHKFFHVDGHEWADLFSAGGCGCAGENWKKAVAYVRKFVERRGGV